MHERARATLLELRQADWFTRVGIVDTRDHVVLSSWREAVDSCSSTAWSNLLLEASNRYREQLAARSKERFQNWNQLVRELKKLTVPLVREKVGPVSDKYNLPVEFENTVLWAVLGVCMEAEYADVYPPGFYASMAYWYVNGHFPCGWSDGEFPEGRLVIY